MKLSMFAVAIFSGLILASVAASAIEAPQPKPGLWELRTQYTSDSKGAEGSDVEQQCETASEQAGGKRFAEDDDRRHCSKNETHLEGGKWVTNKVCKIGNITRSIHTVTAISDHTYHTVMTVISNPPEAGRSRTTTTIDARWLNACKAD